MPLDCAVYVASQCLGATAAAGLALPIAKFAGFSPIGHPAIAPDTTSGSLIAEIVLTFALCHVVIHTATTCARVFANRGANTCAATANPKPFVEPPPRMAVLRASAEHNRVASRESARARHFSECTQGRGTATPHHNTTTHRNTQHHTTPQHTTPHHDTAHTPTPHPHTTHNHTRRPTTAEHTPQSHADTRKTSAQEDHKKHTQTKTRDRA